MKLEKESKNLLLAWIDDNLSNSSDPGEDFFAIANIVALLIQSGLDEAASELKQMLESAIDDEEKIEDAECRLKRDYPEIYKNYTEVNV